MSKEIKRKVMDAYLYYFGKSPDPKTEIQDNDHYQNPSAIWLNLNQFIIIEKNNEWTYENLSAFCEAIGGIGIMKKGLFSFSSTHCPGLHPVTVSSRQLINGNNEFSSFIAFLWYMNTSIEWAQKRLMAWEMEKNEARKSKIQDLVWELEILTGKKIEL